ncbi:MAG: precorrin-6A reductase [Bacillus sp. (in: firmicutes)]
MILVFGGTSDSLEICDYLEEHSFPFIVSVTAEYDGALAEKHAAHVIRKQMDSDGMVAYMKAFHIRLVIDASYFFEAEVSLSAIAACEELNIDYVRFERENTGSCSPLLHVVDDMDAACREADALGMRIFLTTGSKDLADYLKRLPDKHVIARVLPVAEVIHHCERLGLIADQIVAMKGPFSTELNKAIFRATEADAVITKEAGHNGGFKEKVEACLELGIPCIVIRRPKLDYPHKVSTIQELAAYLYHHMSDS